jgi:hypothetical protein
MIAKIYAGVVVTDLERARSWYAKAFGRAPDATPMDGLIEWHAGECVLQIVDIGTVRKTQKLPDWGTPGAASVTLVADDLDALDASFKRVSHFDGPKFSTTSVTDPDGNIVTFLQEHDGAAKT